MLITLHGRRVEYTTKNLVVFDFLTIYRSFSQFVDKEPDH